MGRHAKIDAEMEAKNMDLFNSIVSWACAICENFLCYCFIDRFTGSSLIKKNKYYVAACSIFFGTILGYNRNNWELLSWIMLLLITFGIYITLLLKRYKNSLVTFSVILLYNVCLGLLQLHFLYLCCSRVRM